MSDADAAVICLAIVTGSLVGLFLAQVLGVVP